ncbi:hypothetical protein [Rhizobium johnstonii]
MVTKVTLGEGVTFDVIYSPKRLVVKDGKTHNDFQNQIFDPELVRLWRYVPQQTDTIPAGAYWSELETEYAHLADEATGIGVDKCVWRAEWTFPISNALTYLAIGERRWSDAGVIREYSNTVDIPADGLTWIKMRSARCWWVGNNCWARYSSHTRRSQTGHAGFRLPRSMKAGFGSRPAENEKRRGSLPLCRDQFHATMLQSATVAETLAASFGMKRRASGPIISEISITRSIEGGAGLAGRGAQCAMQLSKPGQRKPCLLPLQPDRPTFEDQRQRLHG